MKQARWRVYSFLVLLGVLWIPPESVALDKRSIPFASESSQPLSVAFATDQTSSPNPSILGLQNKHLSSIHALISADTRALTRSRQQALANQKIAYASAVIYTAQLTAHVLIIENHKNHNADDFILLITKVLFHSQAQEESTPMGAPPNATPKMTKLSEGDFREDPFETTGLYNKMDEWIDEGQDWDTFKENLIAETQQPEETAEIFYLEFKKLQEHVSLPAEILLGGTPEKIVSFMNKQFRYASDQLLFGKKDYWQNPVELLELKKGDCEDFATFADQLMRINGFHSFILTIHGPGNGHAVAVYKAETGNFNVINNMKIQRTKTKNLLKLLAIINPDWITAGIVFFHEANRQPMILKEIRR